MRNRETPLRLVRPENEGSPFPKASLWLRGGARSADIIIAYTLYSATGPAGIVMAMLYLLFADAMFQGQSAGKKIFGIKVVFVPTGQGARHRDSFLRNAPFGLCIILSRMPELGGRAFLAGCVVIGLLETLRSVRDPLGIRYGDVWAQTQVTDGKILLGQGQPIPQQRPAHATSGRSMKNHLSKKHDS